MRLKPWAETTSAILAGLSAHFMGWLFAASMGWKFWVGVIGFAASVVGMLIVAGVGRLE